MLRPEVASARTLRRSMTYPEVLLWQRLRGSPAGLRFRRQHPVGPYVVDFCCTAARLVVEVDGEVHAEPAALARDPVRDRFLSDNGFDVVRLRSADILRGADVVTASIVALAARPLHPSPSASGPPPRAGEDQE